MPALVIARARRPTIRALSLALAALLVAVAPRATRASQRAAAWAGARAPAHAPSVPANVLLARARSEPALAVDPRDGRRIAVVANPDYFHLRPDEPSNGTFASADGGATWAQGAAPTYGNFTGVADPSVGTDATGQTYYLYMGETPSFCGENGNVALLLAHSPDGGRTFGPPTVLDINPTDDKPFLAVSSFEGRTALYVTFDRWLAQERQILFMRSLDGGRTFSPPAVLDATSEVDFGAIPVATAHGQVYVLWSHYLRSNYYGPLQASIEIRASTDAGRTFAPAVTISSFAGLPEMLMPGALRDFTLPTAAIGRHGRLYVAWIRARAMARPLYAAEMDGDLVLSRSGDGGRTWTTPVVLNDSPLGDRFMPTLATAPDGTLQAAFYDRRSDHVHFALYGVAARDLGDRMQLWPNRRISTALSSPYSLHYIAPGSTCVAPGRFMGDYIDAGVSPDGALNVAWDDTAYGVPQETDLWFCRVPAAYLQSGNPRTVPW